MIRCFGNVDVTQENRQCIWISWCPTCSEMTFKTELTAFTDKLMACQHLWRRLPELNRFECAGWWYNIAMWTSLWWPGSVHGACSLRGESCGGGCRRHSCIWRKKLHTCWPRLWMNLQELYFPFHSYAYSQSLNCCYCQLWLQRSHHTNVHANILWYAGTSTCRQLLTRFLMISGNRNK